LSKTQASQTKAADLQEPTPAESGLQEVSTANCAEKIHGDNPWRRHAGDRARKVRGRISSAIMGAPVGQRQGSFRNYLALDFRFFVKKQKNFPEFCPFLSADFD